MQTAQQLRDDRLTTAEVLYLPDHPAVLQSYVCQEMDLGRQVVGVPTQLFADAAFAPGYPMLHRVLAFWQPELHGKLHSVRAGSARLIQPGKLRHISEYKLH